MRPGLMSWVVALGFCAAIPGLRAEQPPPHNRAEAVKIIADLQRIVTPDGIDRHEKVRIGGIEQWVSIRGNDRRNPVLLMVHGGPGWVSMPTSWYFQRGWEEYFTVVQWDQRGAGSTYAANDPAAVAPTIAPDRMVADTEEMVAWLRKEFGQRKIFVLGHSWGSYLGLEVARRHPDWLHAYIGIGQMTNMPESERQGWEFAMREARKAGNAQAVRELESIAPYAAGTGPAPLSSVMIQRKWLDRFGGMVYGRTGGDAESAAMTLSPEYTDSDLQAVDVASQYSMQKLLSTALTVDFSNVRHIDCPVLLFLGRHDHNVSSSVAEIWFNRLQAPTKRLVWFENSAHEVMVEEPGKTLVSLVRYVLPLAGGSATIGKHTPSAGDGVP